MNFVGRWRHLIRLDFRVWPRNAYARKAMRTMTEIPVHGFGLNVSGKFEAQHQLGSCGYFLAGFELSDDDAAILLSIGDSGAKLANLRLVCPGTENENASLACYLRADVRLNRHAPHRSKGHGRWKGCAAPAPIPQSVRCFENEIVDHVRARLAQHGIPPEEVTGYELFTNPAAFDIDTAVRAILSGKAAILQARYHNGKNGFTGRQIAEIRRRLVYYTVPGRDPCEDGGFFRGYQMCDFVFSYWPRVMVDSGTLESAREHCRRMHEIHREKGRVNRRAWLVGETIERVAVRYGVSRELVTRRFNEEGIVPYLMKWADEVPFPKVMRQAKTLLCRHATNATDMASFIIDGLDAPAPEGEEPSRP